MRSRLALLLGVIAATVLLGASPAAALGIDCKADPPMSGPLSGPAASLDPGPAEPLEQTPTADDPTAGSWYMSQGYGGMAWENYDLGCDNKLSGGVSDTEANLAGWLASAGLDNLTVAFAGMAWLIRLVLTPETIGLLDPFLAIGSYVFGGSVFLPALAVTGGIAGLWFILRSAKDSLSHTFSAAGTVGAIVCLSLIALAFPLVIAHGVDRLVTTGTGVVFDQAASAGARGAELVRDAQAGESPAATPGQPQTLVTSDLSPADQVINAVHHGVLYETWRSGVFGRSAGASADKYGPCLFANSARTFAEEALPVDERNALAEDKANRYKDCASAYAEEDPEGYRYLAGHENNDRLAYVTLGWIAFALLAVMLVGALGLLLYSLVVVRAVLAILPLIGALAVIPTLAKFFWKPLDIAARALMIGAVAGCIAAVDTAVITALMSPTSGVDMLTAAVLMLLLNIALWQAIRKGKQEIERRARIPRTASADHTDTSDDGMPSEGRNRGGAFRGAAGGAAQGAVMGALGGGFAGAAAGAGRGAALGAAAATSSRIAGSPMPGITVAAGGASRPGIPAAETTDATYIPTDTTGQAALGPGEVPASPTVSEPGIEVYRPYEAGPAAPTHTQGADDVYEVWTPIGGQR